MKNVKIFDRRSKCLDFILGELVTVPELVNHHFYRGLIEWIVDNRAPIFFEASQDFEYSHFTQYLSFVLIRKSYSNPYLQSLYYLHDFMHMIFNNPVPPTKVSFEHFSKTAIANEFYASNETEILVYYRVPELRKKTLEGTILFDLLQAKNYKASVKKLYKLRTRIINHQLSTTERHYFEQVLPFFNRFPENNAIWCKLWYQSFPNLVSKAISRQRNVMGYDYEQTLTEYSPALSESIYNRNLRRNLIIGSELLGHPNQFSYDLQSYQLLFENQIILKQVAQKFHQLYLARKLLYQGYQQLKDCASLVEHTT